MREKRRQNIKNRVIALIMSLLTVISVLSPNATKTVNADYVRSYPVTINFYKFDGETELYNLKYIDSPINGTLFILATLTDKETGKVVGYGYTKIRRLEKQHDTFYIRDFYTVDEEDRGWITTAKKNPITYNTDKHDISIRLYSCDTDPDNAYGGLSLGYSTLIKQNDNFDGFVFDNQAGETSGVINASQGNLEYGIRLEFDSENIVIDEKSNYYILATATKGSGEKVYYYSQLTTDGSKINDINVKNSENYGFSDWQNSNGNSTISKYSDSWLPIDIKILKAKDGESPNLNSALSGTNVTVVNEIKGNKINHVGVTREKDSSAKKVIDYDVVKFSQIEVSEDYNYLSILGDAVNYGIVSKTIIQNDHSETNFATTSYDPNGKNFDSDLSGNGTVQIPGNYLVGEITGSSNMRIGNNTPGTTLVMVGKGYEDKVQDETSEHYAVIIPMPKDDIDSAVENMIDHMKIVSADMAKKEATITPEIVAGNMYIDTTSFPDGSTIYIDADAYDYYYGEGNKGPLRKDEGLNISMLPNQTIVFNFKTTDEVYIGKAHVNFNDGTGVHDTHTDTGKYKNEQNQFADKIARQLVWNCPVAKSVETHIAGGIYLAPNENVNMVLGDTTCGWGISAGNTTMGNKGEFHYVYDGLSDSNSITLHAYKRVDGVNAASGQTFKFGVQRFDYTANAFVDVLIDGKDSEGNDTKVPYIVENKNEIISIPINYMEDGLNTFRVYEIGKDDNTQGKFKSNKQEFYAQFNVNVIDVKGAQYKVPGGVTYYSKADADGNVSEKLSAEKVVFENETAGNCFVVSKKVTGDEDSSNPYFDITIIGKDSDKDDASPIVGEYDVDGIENADTLAFNLLGIATAKIRKDESITVMGLPEGAYLSVMEAAADGYTLTTAKENLSGIVTNDINNPTKVELVNEYTAPKFATLIIEKSIDGENLTESEIAGALKFTVVDEDGKYLYVDSDGIVQRDEDKVELIVGKDFEKNEGRYILVFKGLPVGEKYTVTETNTDVEGYNLTKATVDNVEVEKTAITKQLEIIEDVDNKVEIKDTYEKIPTTGNLIFTKTVGGDVTEEEVEGALTFTVTTEKEGKTYYLGTDGKLTEDEVVITLKDSIVSHTDGTKVWTAKIEGVEPGKYTVKEKNTAIKAADGSNYTYEFLSEKSVTEKNATVEAGKDVTAALKDEYEKKLNPTTGSLTFTKTVGGDVTEEEVEGALTFTVTTEKEGKTYYLGTDGKLTEDEVVITLKDSIVSHTDGTKVWTAKIEGVEPGKYTVKEKNTAIKAADGSNYTYEFLSEKSVTEKAAEVKAGEDATAALKDEYEKKMNPTTGNLIFTKTVGGDVTEEEVEGALTFTVTTEKEGKTYYLGTDGKLTEDEVVITLKDSIVSHTDGTKVWTAKIEDVEPGKYTVKEKNTAIKAADGSNYTYEFLSEKSVTEKAAEVKAGEDATAALKDEYEKKLNPTTGSLTFTKTVGGDVTEEEVEGALTFTVTTEKEGKTYYLGTDGKLTEDEVVITLKDSIVSHTDGTKVWTAKIEGVEPGKYTVKEKNTAIKAADGSNYTYEFLSEKSVTEKNATVEAGKDATAALKDEYEKKLNPTTGSLTFTKTVGGDVTEEEVEGALTFTVTTEKEGKTYYLGTDGKLTEDEVVITLKDSIVSHTDGTKVWTAKIEDVEPGKYTVKEKNTAIKAADGSNYTYEFLSEKSVTEKNATVEAGKDVTAALKDEYEKKMNPTTGNLIFTKTVGGDVTEEEVEGALTFTVTTEKEGKTYYLGTDGKLTEDEVVITLKDSIVSHTDGTKVWTAKIEGVEPGKYTVKEKNTAIKAADGSNYTYEFLSEKSVTEKNATVEAGKDATAALKDEYEKKMNPTTGNLIFTKTVGGDVTEEEVEGALTFTVTTEKEGKTYYLGTDGKLTEDEVVITLKDSIVSHTDGTKVWTAKIEGVEPGKYTVKEKNTAIKAADGSNYTYEFLSEKSVTEKAAEVKAGEDTTAALKDEYEKKMNPTTGNLIFTKTVGGDVTEEEVEGALTFTVTTEKEGKTYYLGTDGKLTEDEVVITLKDSIVSHTDGTKVWTAKIEGVEPGKYTVKEKNTAIKAADGSNYTYEFLSEKSVTEKNATVEAGKDVTAALKDEYEKKMNPTTGNLIFTKTVGGDVTEEEVEGALTFTVTTEKEGKTYYLGTDGKLTEDEVVITLKDSIVSHTDGTKVWTAKIEDVEPGKYTVKEKNTAIKAADGSNYTYEFLSEKSVTEKNATVEAGKDVTAALKDEYEKKTEDKFDVQISKQDVNGKEISGAEIKVTKADDDTAVVDSWTSEADTTHVMKDVPAGSYVLTEVNAPTGYEKVTTAIEFKVAEDGKVTVTSTVTDGLVKVDDQGRLVITNKPEKSEPKTVDVNISKQDIDGNEIAGAEIKVTKAGDDTAVVDSWTSEENKTHTIKGVTAGDYVLTEENAPAGYEKVTTAIEFTVAEDGTITVTSKNTDGVVKVDDQGRLVITNKPEKSEPKKTGALKITKSFAKDCITESEKEGGLQFRVTTKENGKTYYLDGEGKLTDTETTFTLSADFDYDSATNTWTKTFNNVPVGNYTVEETNTEIEGYKFKGSTINGTDVTDGTAVTITVDADKEAAANIVDDYEKVAELTVKKAVTDSDAAAAAAGKTYRIALKNSKGEFYNGYEFIAVAQYFDVTVDKAYTFKNLPVGETYTVVEDLGENNAKVVLSGFTFSGNEVADVELNDNSEVTVINKYTRDMGDLVITKLVKGPVTEEEFNGAITFSVKDENGNAINVTKNDGTTGTSENMTVKDYFTVKEVDGGYECTLTIKDVPTGKYTVTETNSTFDGYELVSQTGGGEVAVVKGEEAISDFVDEYKAETGSLEIVKDFKEAPENLDASQIVFEISGPKHFNNGEKLVVTYAQFTDGKYVINDAPIGKYTVTETSREETKVDGAYKYTFSNEGSTVTGSREVLKGAKATVTLKNVYDKEELLGSLTVNKSVSMNNGSDFPEGSDLASKTYYVEVRNTDTGLYVAGDGKYSESPVKLEVAAGQPLVLNNIRLGNYTVSEDVADATSVDNRVVYDGSTSVAEASTALTEDSQNQSVTISNVYKHYEEEEIVDYPVFFSKEDSLSGAEVEGATIELYKGDSATGSPYKTWVSSLTSHVENLEEGTYTFKETVAPTGYDVVETAITFTVAKDEEAAKGYSVKIISLSDEVAYQRVDGTLVLKNDPMLGILKVVKVVKTDSGNMPVVDGFNVTIKNLKNNMYVQSVDGKLGKDAKDIFIPIGEDGVGSVEITGLRPATYLVVEKDADAKNVAGFIYDANGSIAELKEEIRLDGDAVKGAEVELVNQYSEDVGKLAITKKITGENPGKSEFKVTVTNPDGKYLTADGKLTDSETVLTVKAGETLTITGVPSGKYTVKEDVADAGNVSGVQFDSDNSIVAKDATVTFGETAEVELVNNYSEIETGKIVVHVTEENSKKDVPDAEVVITNKTTGEEKTYKTNDKGEIVDENGKTPEVPSGDYTIVITDVPEGYNVTTGETGTVTVPKNDTGKHEAVISTERGGIIITVFDEETGSVVPGAKITITTPDGKTNTFVTDVNGQVTEYAKRDQFGNYTEVPGTFKYVVEEVPTGYSVTTGKVQTGTVVKNKLTELVAKIKPLTGGLDIQVVDEKTSKPVENATVEVKTPDGVTVELITDQNGMINKFTEKDKNGNYTAKVGEYDITVTKVPAGYSVTTGQTKSETVVEGEVKHHIAKIAATNKTTVTDTNNQTNNNKTNTNNNTNNNKTNTKKTDTNAKTGDAADIAGVTGLMLLSLAAVVAVIRRKKEDEE